MKRFSFLKYFFSIILESIYKIIASATNLNKFNQKHNSYAFSVQNTSTSCIPTFIPLSCQLHSTYLNLSTKKDKYEKKLGKRSIIFLTSLSMYYELTRSTGAAISSRPVTDKTSPVVFMQYLIDLLRQLQKCHPNLNDITIIICLNYFGNTCI